MRRLLHVLSWVLVSWTLLVSVASAAITKEIQLTISDLHPTQAVISHEQVAYKIAKYQRDPSAFVDDLNELPRKTVVLGPQQQYFLTDGHHTFSAMLEYSPAGAEQPITVELTDDLSHLDTAAFWDHLIAHDMAWLSDEKGQPLFVADLPSGVGRALLRDDPLRGAMYWLRKRVLEKPEPAIPFLEFHWAQYLREHTDLAQPPLERSPVNDLRWISALGEFIAALPASTPVGPNGETAAAMGQLKPQRGQPSLVSDPSQRGLPFLAPIWRTSAYIYDGKLVRAVVEIPAGTTQKWQLTKDGKQLEWELEEGQPRVVQYLPYPVNYGALPDTLSDRATGGDGDPYDVLILGDALPRGSQLDVRVIARMKMRDNGEIDDKLIAVVPEDPIFGKLQSLADLEQQFPGTKSILRNWFSNYKGSNGSISGIEFTPETQ
ncbi:ParB-like protein [Pseudidiomarina sp. YC-516-91]|uniref:ParB-like protein n=1 Tax=Pseudidiomarina salilacus TaxID=3384452 RepID=UPI003984F201